MATYVCKNGKCMKILCPSIKLPKYLLYISIIIPLITLNKPLTVYRFTSYFFFFIITTKKEKAAVTVFHILLLGLLNSVIIFCQINVPLQGRWLSCSKCYRDWRQRSRWTFRPEKVTVFNSPSNTKACLKFISQSAFARFALY